MLDDVEADVSRQLAEAAGAAAEAGFVAVMMSAVEAWLELCDRPDIQRILLVDGPSVVGWARWREICQRHVLGFIQTALEQGMATGEVRRQPIVPLSHALIAVADEAAMYVAAAADPAVARAEMVHVARQFITALRPV
ncbi:hypothetical protein [Jiangella sp. DSM 45060]|uniref:hypothetical protein n=1 Tax=Jiangella sp. DSM 45060 TaxID=1798224 RepID=UPI0018D2EE50|nr:hypothetical protein [Jiangella sp. DSM 45060]